MFGVLVSSATIRRMNLPLPIPTMRRLTIVKYLYEQALEQERKGGPLAGLALLPLHDAVELFLQVAAEAAAETNSLTMTSKQRSDFMEYWTAFSAAGLPLPYEQRMRRFNTARVEVKHRGLLPIQQQIEEFRSDVTNFLVDATPKVFQLEFDSISLSSLVQSDDVRTALQTAETAAEAGQFDAALEQAAKAFHLSLRNHQWFKTPRLFDPTDAARGLRQRGQQLDPSLSDLSGFTRAFQLTAQMGESLGEAITILAYHLDYDGYRYLRTYGPVIHIVGLGGMAADWTQEPTTDRSIVDRCVAFAVDAALRLEGVSLAPLPVSPLLPPAAK
jgi:hypothetical protein